MKLTRSIIFAAAGSLVALCLTIALNGIVYAQTISGDLHFSGTPSIQTVSGQCFANFDFESTFTATVPVDIHVYSDNAFDHKVVVTATQGIVTNHVEFSKTCPTTSFELVLDADNLITETDESHNSNHFWKSLIEDTATPPATDTPTPDPATKTPTPTPTKASAPISINVDGPDGSTSVVVTTNGDVDVHFYQYFGGDHTFEYRLCNGTCAFQITPQKNVTALDLWIDPDNRIGKKTLFKFSVFQDKIGKEHADPTATHTSSPNDPTSTPTPTPTNTPSANNPTASPTPAKANFSIAKGESSLTITGTPGLKLLAYSWSDATLEGGKPFFCQLGAVGSSCFVMADAATTLIELAIDPDNEMKAKATLKFIVINGKIAKDIYLPLVRR